MNQNQMIGLIIKSEPQMTGIYRWSCDLIEAMKQYHTIQSFPVAAPESFLYRYVLYPTGTLIGKDPRTAFLNYPRHVFNPQHVQPKIWHLASQTFGAITPDLLSANVCTVATIHDLYPYVFDTYPSRKDKKGYLNAIAGLKKASYFLTNSRSAKIEVQTALNVDSDRVKTVHPGISDIFLEHDTVKKTNSILYVGSELPRKNLERLFHALAKVFKVVPKAHFTKVGTSQWGHSRKTLVTIAKQYGILDRITFIDHLKDDSDLVELYSSTALTVLPSTHEGFGYPLVEAMACGSPTVVSDIPVLHEISAGNSIFVDPWDPESIAQGMIDVLNSKSLQAHLRAGGLARSKYFRFEPWRKRILHFYSDIAKRYYGQDSVYD